MNVGQKLAELQSEKDRIVREIKLLEIDLRGVEQKILLLGQEDAPTNSQVDVVDVVGRETVVGDGIPAAVENAFRLDPRRWMESSEIFELVKRGMSAGTIQSESKNLKDAVHWSIQSLIKKGKIDKSGSKRKRLYRLKQI